MKQTLEKKENFAEILGFVNANMNRDLPFIPNVAFLGDVWAGDNKMFACIVCAERDGTGEIQALSVRLVSPNPAYKDDVDVKLALQIQPDMAGVVRYMDFGDSVALREFADLVANNQAA